MVELPSAAGCHGSEVEVVPESGPVSSWLKCP